MNHLTRREADKLIRDHFAFARKRARYFHAKRPDLDYDELESRAMQALAGSVDRFDPSAGFVFATYAGSRIDGYMLAYNRDERKRRKRRSEALLSYPIEDTSPDHADAILDGMEERVGLADWLDMVSDPRHQEAVLRRLRGERVPDIADRFEVSDTTVYRWLNSARKIGQDSIS